MRLSLMRSVFGRALLFSSLLWMVSCGSKKDEDTEVSVTATYDSLWTNFFDGRCGSCHGGGADVNAVGSPDMRTKEEFHAGLVGVKGSEYKSWKSLAARTSCVEKQFIEAGSASDSLVVAVLDPSVKPCTVKSHYKEGPQNIEIAEQTLAALKQWINDGAKL